MLKVYHFFMQSLMGKAQTFSMQRFMGAFISMLQAKHLEQLYRIEN